MGHQNGWLISPSPGMEPSGLQMCVPHPPQTTHIVSAMVRELMAAAVGDLLEAGKGTHGDLQRGYEVHEELP